MKSGGEAAIKCYKTVHGAGREPWVYERPCTAKEIAERKAEIKEAMASAMTAQEKLKALEGRREQYNRLMAMCEKKFGPTVCNR